VVLFILLILLLIDFYLFLLLIFRSLLFTSFHQGVKFPFVFIKLPSWVLRALWFWVSSTGSFEVVVDLLRRPWILHRKRYSPRVPIIFTSFNFYFFWNLFFWHVRGNHLPSGQLNFRSRSVLKVQGFERLLVAWCWVVVLLWSIENHFLNIGFRHTTYVLATVATWLTGDQALFLLILVLCSFWLKNSGTRHSCSSHWPIRGWLNCLHIYLGAVSLLLF